MRRIVGKTFDFVTRTIINLQLLRAPRARVGAILVADLGDQDPAQANTLDRLSAALDAVRDVSPRRFQRMQRDVRRVLAAYIPVFALYHSGSATIFVQHELIAEQDAKGIAVLLVHEATHARIAHAGVKLNPQNKLQVERRCYLEQIDFASQLRGGAPLVEWSLNGLSALLDVKVAAQGEVALHEQQLLNLEEQGAPSWLVRVFRRFRLFDPA